MQRKYSSQLRNIYLCMLIPNTTIQNSGSGYGSVLKPLIDDLNIFLN